MPFFYEIPYSGLKDIEFERLGQIGIGPCLIAFKTDVFRCPGRKQDDRDVESLDIVLDCLRDLENLIQI